MPKSRKPKAGEPAVQYAALPYRRVHGAIEVMLVTSRETRRWVVPKGWPMKKLAPHEAAAREAYEEAGVEGEVGAEPIGAFDYLKRQMLGVRHCRVEVFPLQVTQEHDLWPECSQRSRRWFASGEAAGAVQEPELQALIEAFARRLAT